MIMDERLDINRGPQVTRRDRFGCSERDRLAFEHTVWGTRNGLGLAILFWTAVLLAIFLL